MRIKLTKNTATPDLRAKMEKVGRKRVFYQAGAKAVQVEISSHLRRLQARGNRKGWPSQKFFAGKSTSVEKNVGITKLSDAGAEITIADPRFVHRITGGDVTRKRKRNIAIPLTAEAYAAAGRGSIIESMPGLEVIKFPRGVYLCRTVDARGKEKARIFPLFKLVKSVTHNPHPEEAPDENVLRSAALKAMHKVGDLLLTGTG